MSDTVLLKYGSDEDDEYESSFEYIYSHDTMSSEEMKEIVDRLMKDEVPGI